MNRFRLHMRGCIGLPAACTGFAEQSVARGLEVCIDENSFRCLRVSPHLMLCLYTSFPWQTGQIWCQTWPPRMNNRIRVKIFSIEGIVTWQNLQHATIATLLQLLL